MSSGILIGNKMLQERIDVLEEQYLAERDLNFRNAAQAIRFQNALEKITKLRADHLQVAQKIAEEALGIEKKEEDHICCSTYGATRGKAGFTHSPYCPNFGGMF